MKKQTHPLRSRLTIVTAVGLLAALAFLAHAKFHREAVAPVYAFDGKTPAPPKEWSYPGANGEWVFAVDRTGSGRPNEWTYFDADGNVLRFEKDRGGTGRVDTRDFYRHDKKTGRDVIVRAERAEACGPLIDAISWFDANGGMARMERDRNCDGKIDMIAYYDDPNRAPYKIVWDDNYDGSFGRTTYRDGAPSGPAVSAATPAVPAPSASPSPR